MTRATSYSSLLRLVKSRYIAGSTPVGTLLSRGGTEDAPEQLIRSFIVAQIYDPVPLPEARFVRRLL